MSTIKTWQEREQLDIEPIRLPEECYMQDEIDELREALKAAQAQIDSFCMDYRIKCDAETKALQAKLSAIEAQEPVAWANRHDLPNFDMKVRTCGGPLHTIPLYAAPVAPAQPVNELVEALEYVLDTHFCTGNDGDDARARAHKALKVAQENVEHLKAARESAMFAGEQMQAKLSAP